MPSFYGENPPDTEVGSTDATESQVSEDAVTETDTSGGFFQGSPEQTTTEAYEEDARQAKEAAETAQTAAEAAQAAAEASESAASSSESNAASSQTAAATSATNASNSASAAAGSATTAATQASNAASSATAAAGSASNAASSESAAASSETAAASSQTAAAGSATAAASSAGTASTKASEAATSATNAAASESAAASSESNASTSASQAATSATNAASSESAAASSETNAASSASAASTSASNAASSASAASSSATAAASSASSASTSATAAGSARDAALAALDSFDDRYLGQKSSDPSLDNDGNALVAGALYFDTVNTVMKVYDGSQWLAAYASVSGALLAINNLNDVSNTATARSNLGLGTASEQNVTYFATAAQGSLADSALQNGDNVSVLTNDSGYLTGNQTITLTGDVSGSGTTSIAVTIADDSHNHVISNVDGLQTALDGKVDLAGDTMTGTLNGTNFLASGTIGNLTSGSQGQQMEKGDTSVTTLRFDADRWRLYAGNNAGEIISAYENGNIDFTTGNLLKNGTAWMDNSRNMSNIGTISSGAITSSGASSGRYTGLEIVNTTSAAATETAIGLGVVSAINSACDVKLVANRVGNNAGSDFYIEQTDSSGNQQETFRITEAGAATFAGRIGINGKTDANAQLAIGDTATWRIRESGNDLYLMDPVSSSNSRVLYLRNTGTGGQMHVDMYGNFRINGTTVINSSTVGSLSQLNVINGSTPTINIYDNGNGAGGGASGKIIFQNTSGDAIGIGYTGDSTADSDLIISTNAGGTYGGYLGLDAGAISDTKADIILEPLTQVLVSSAPLKISNSVFGEHLILYREDSTNSSSIKFTNTAGTAGILYGRHSDNELVWRDGTSTNNFMLWHQGNDGSGSGLDADTVDGVQGSSFLRSDANDSWSGTLTATIAAGSNALDLATNDAYASMRVIRNTKSSGSGSDGMYIGYGNANGGLTRIYGGGATSGGLFINGSGANDLKYNNASVLWHAGNDGSGSGLDADTLDGYQASQFMHDEFMDDAYVDFTVGGNADTYYPVSIQGGGTHAFQTYSITRQYNWAAPNTWNTSSHRGGLTLTWQYSGDSFWGGNDHDIRIIKFDETYSTMVMGMAGSVGGGGTHAGVVVWLRGGNADYRFYGPRGKLGDVNVHLTSVTASNGTVFSSRTFNASTRDGEINPKYPIRDSSLLYDSNSRVWSAGNDGSGSGLDADLLDGVHGSSFLRSDASDDFTGDFLEFQDNKVLRFGTSADYRIWHEGGGHTYFRNYGAGTNTYFQGEDNAGTNHAMIYLRGDTSAPFVQLFYDGSEKMRTSSAGIDVYNNVNAISGYMVNGTTIINSSRAAQNLARVSLDAASGNGYNFWDGNGAYVIYMSNQSDSTYGGRVDRETTSDYNMYFKMQSGTNRGFVFRDNANNYASINPNGIYSEVPFILDNSDTAHIQMKNASYGTDLYIGGWTTANSNNISRIRNSSGNLHIDSAANGHLYLNHYSTGNIYARGHTVWHAGNDGSGSGLDADTLDGVQAASFLRSDTADTLSTTLTLHGYVQNGGDGHRDKGLFGNYNSYKTNAIWGIGTGYRSHASGTDFGNLYGAAYKHTNNSTGGTMAGSHQFVWCHNGSPKAALGSNIWTSGNVTAYSDIRVKTNLEVIPEALSKVMRLTGYTFERTDVTYDEEGVPETPIRQTGVVAQEVLEVLPEAVTGDEENHYSVAYGNMVGLLIEAIKELKAEVDDLKAQLEDDK